jgi:glycosyltransferase involved in cell wall biosynthesis
MLTGYEGMRQISIVILTRNSSRTIRQCLEALMPISNMIGEVVIVDGNSVDDTLKNRVRIRYETSFGDFK